MREGLHCLHPPAVSKTEDLVCDKNSSCHSEYGSITMAQDHKDTLTGKTSCNLKALFSKQI
jgi:hypothetical protein